MIVCIHMHWSCIWDAKPLKSLCPRIHNYRHNPKPSLHLVFIALNGSLGTVISGRQKHWSRIVISPVCLICPQGNRKTREGFYWQSDVHDLSCCTLRSQLIWKERGLFRSEPQQKLPEKLVNNSFTNTFCLLLNCCEVDVINTQQAFH